MTPLESLLRAAEALRKTFTVYDEDAARKTVPDVMKLLDTFDAALARYRAEPDPRAKDESDLSEPMWQAMRDSISGKPVMPPWGAIASGFEAVLERDAKTQERLAALEAAQKAISESSALAAAWNMVPIGARTPDALDKIEMPTDAEMRAAAERFRAARAVREGQNEQNTAQHSAASQHEKENDDARDEEDDQVRVDRGTERQGNLERDAGAARRDPACVGQELHADRRSGEVAGSSPSVGADRVLGTPLSVSPPAFARETPREGYDGEAGFGRWRNCTLSYDTTPGGAAVILSVVDGLRVEVVAERTGKTLEECWRAFGLPPSPPPETRTDAVGIAAAPEGTKPCAHCKNENVGMEIRTQKYPGMTGFSVVCGWAFCGARGPVRPAQMDAVAEWNKVHDWYAVPPAQPPKRETGIDRVAMAREILVNTPGLQFRDPSTAWEDAWEWARARCLAAADVAIRLVSEHVARVTAERDEARKAQVEAESALCDRVLDAEIASAADVRTLKAECERLTKENVRLVTIEAAFSIMERERNATRARAEAAEKKLEEAEKRNAMKVLPDTVPSPSDDKCEHGNCVAFHYARGWNACRDQVVVLNMGTRFKSRPPEPDAAPAPDEAIEKSISDEDLANALRKAANDVSPLDPFGDRWINVSESARVYWLAVARCSRELLERPSPAVGRGVTAYDLHDLDHTRHDPGNRFMGDFAELNPMTLRELERKADRLNAALGVARKDDTAPRPASTKGGG